jgi:uncharacterized protein YndB with AHSA1/START domain
MTQHEVYPWERIAPGYPAILERQIRIRATPDEIYPYFVDPEKMKLWQGIEAKLDPRPGGVYWINVTGKDILSGEYVLLEPPTRILLKWGWETPGHPIRPSSTDVEITFNQEGETTRVLVRHANIPEEHRLPMGVGWQHYLTRLAIVAMGRDPGRDPWIDEGGPPMHDHP